MDRSLGVTMGQWWLPRDSTVQSIDHPCTDGEQGVRVATVDPWYRKKDVRVVQVGEVGCVPSVTLQTHTQTPKQSDAESRLLSEYTARFGAVENDAIKSTPWGRIALPMHRELSEAEQKAEHLREGLITQKQQARAVVAEGPYRDGAPVYAHFLGSDAPRSDRWATLSTVLQLMTLADGWANHCRRTLPSTIAEANPETCLLQIGDLGWYNDTVPDPLGHRAHYRGSCVDIRLFRTVASRYEAWWNRPDDRTDAKGGYSQALTQAFLQFAIETANVTDVHFNDPAIQRALPAVTPARGHDDHIHLCFSDG